jgi:hypothetical protein
MSLENTLFPDNFFGIEPSVNPDQSPLSKVPSGHHFNIDATLPNKVKIDTTDVYANGGFIMCHAMLNFYRASKYNNDIVMSLDHLIPEDPYHKYIRYFDNPLIERSIMILQPHSIGSEKDQATNIIDKLLNFPNIIVDRLNNETHHRQSFQNKYALHDLAPAMQKLLDIDPDIPVNILTTRFPNDGAKFKITIGNGNLVIWDEETKLPYQSFSLNDLYNWNI